MAMATDASPVLIKRYARSRLYDASNGRYVSVETLQGWAAKATPFKVVDVETGEDVTRVLLA